ncbi:RNA polymerase sigma factor [Gaoshiqia sediminis]|uniref:Sigma-70 family RNA polymerase sigma factor n=1 Tax=Gaoshiqia sediminis TaxID=2986998 RepID=A0AA42C4Y2_9BACT|nr:sigma-70 family RNA polymerase sigma factor [Gaoshiqia sediminis]MCW0482253.1 sigma-70 family RNA polymerase sigma factor [Gaoshiqia sediminis]
MINYTNEELLHGILRNDNLILQYIYKNFFYKINFFIKKNSGDDEDSNDIFQEAIIIIYRKLKANDLVLDCSFETYLYSVCRFLWLKQLEKRKNEREKIRDNHDFNDDIYDSSFETTVDMNEKYRLYQKHFKNLGKDCQKILQMFFDKVPLKQIAQVMGFQGEKYAKKRKYKCKEYLVKSIKQDIEYKKILENDL